MEKPILSVENLSVAYDQGENLVVDGVHFQLAVGKVLAIVGESGCGKTSLIRAIMGILPSSGRVTTGDILFDNFSLLHAKKYKRGKDISFVFQNSGAMLNPVVTIGQQFVEYIRVHEKMSKAQARALALESLKKVQLEDGARILDSYPFQLSGGMQQRVGIGMAITFQPKLILADEPTSALDVSTQIPVLDLFHQINQECATAMIIVTHNLGAAAYLADECMVMYQGKVVESNTMSQIIAHPQHPYTQKLLQATVLEKGNENE